MLPSQAACTSHRESGLVPPWIRPHYDVIVIGAGPAGLTAATEAARAGLKCLCLDKLAPGGVLINLGELHDFDEIFSGTADGLAHDRRRRRRRRRDRLRRGREALRRRPLDGRDGRRRAPHRAAPSWSRPASTRAGSACPTRMSTKAAASPTAPPATARSMPACRSSSPAPTAGPPSKPQELVGLGQQGHRDRIATGREAGRHHLHRRPHRRPRRQRRSAVHRGRNRRTARNTIPTSAVFVYVGQSPAAEFLPESLARDATGHIVVDEEGRTSSPTAFAAGDVRAGGRQYLTDAIADGQRAAKAVVAALSKTS